MPRLRQHAETILIVDDTPASVEVLRKTLSKTYQVQSATNADAALAIAKSEQQPDLIMLDIVMPAKDGYQVCRELKANEATRDIPVIFVTGKDQAADEIKGLDAGAVDYITKPFRLPVVLSRIQMHLELKKYREQLEDLVKDRTRELLDVNRQLKTSEKRFRILFEYAPDPYYLIDMDGFILDCNRASEKLTGYVKKELIGRKITQLRQFPRHQVDPAKAILVRTDEGKAAGPFEFVFMRKDGTKRYVDCTIFPVKIKSQEIVLAILRDVSERKELENSLRTENELLRTSINERYRFGSIIGKSPPMQKVYELILKAATSDANVLILGDSGTGKELVARAIHDISARKHKKFLPVNCGAIPKRLFESEFFGYKKGAFTGADADKAGYLDEADGGSLFLDELGEIELDMQVKLLRAIEGGGFTPVGSREVRKPDVRIIAATNQDLRKHIRQGLIREDFFYRINIIPIKLPPLKERKEDIPLLVEHFLQMYSRKKNTTLPARLLDILIQNDWSGNVRELQNVIHRYITLNDEDVIWSIGSEEHQLSRDIEDPPSETLNLNEALGEHERKLIVKALNANKWHRGKAAAALGVTRRTLERKIKLHQLT